MLEKLKERQAQRHRRTLARREGIEQDETATRLFVRQQKVYAE